MLFRTRLQEISPNFVHTHAVPCKLSFDAFGCVCVCVYIPWVLQSFRYPLWMRNWYLVWVQHDDYKHVSDCNLNVINRWIYARCKFNYNKIFPFGDSESLSLFPPCHFSFSSSLVYIWYMRVCCRCCGYKFWYTGNGIFFSLFYNKSLISFEYIIQYSISNFCFQLASSFLSVYSQSLPTVQILKFHVARTTERTHPNASDLHISKRSIRTELCSGG